jgi:succinate-semialdehyde dehydrogenase/glutarate-semialdehyde dehydrogenase
MTKQSTYCVTGFAGTGGFPIPTDLLIGGNWREGSEGARIGVLNPSNGEHLTTIADATLEDGIAAVDAAYAAGPAWAATAPRARAAILLKCFEAMVAKADWLAYLISLENGKALTDARSEVLYAAEFFRWYAEEAVRVHGEIGHAPAGGNRIVVQYQPIGVSLLITPWNFPAAMATRKIAPALAAGCTCILKPATETPLTALAVGEILREAGVPDGVVNIVNTSKTGAVCSKILHDPRVRKLSFTGSTPVGRILLKEAADTIISSSMELGGNAPFLVLDDADLDAAIEGAMIAKMRNAGEACTAANRFYVQEGIYDAFVEKLTERMAALKVGPGTDASTQCGAMINPGALAKIQSLVDDAISKGAVLRLGGKPGEGPGYFYPPSVVTEIPDDAEILRDEIFGPVAAIKSFKDVEDAIRMANDTEYGLAAYVYTQDLRKGMQLSERLEYGMVALNRGLVSDPAAPFGGVKQSGLGREGSHHGLLEFTEAKYIAVTW